MQINESLYTMRDRIEYFFRKYIPQQRIELYNEAGIQHELALFLRQHFSALIVRLEYPHWKTRDGSRNSKLIKEAIDLYIHTLDTNETYAIELKMPINNGGTSEAMFGTIKDIKFLEQLHKQGIDQCFSILLTSNPSFWNGSPHGSPIYENFSKLKFAGDLSSRMPEYIQRTTLAGKPSDYLCLNGSYQSEWNDLGKIDGVRWKWYILTVPHGTY